MSRLSRLVYAEEGVRVKGPEPETVMVVPNESAVVCTGSVTAHRAMPAERAPNRQPVVATVSAPVVPAAPFTVDTHTATRPSSARK